MNNNTDIEITTAAAVQYGIPIDEALAMDPGQFAARVGVLAHQEWLVEQRRMEIVRERLEAAVDAGLIEIVGFTELGDPIYQGVQR